MKFSLNINLLFFVSLLIILIVTAITIGSYTSTFNGSLSNNINDWGAFGSYISGTIGVTVAFLAVTWLITSVIIQKKELEHLKVELNASAAEQVKQTKISALTATVNSIGVSISVAQQKLNACNDGDNHFLPGETPETIKEQMQKDLARMSLLTKELESRCKST